MCFRAPNVVFLCVLFERERFSGGVEVEEVEIPGQASVEICTRNLFSLPIAIRTRQRKKQLNTKNFPSQLFFCCCWHLKAPTFTVAISSAFRVKLDNFAVEQ